MFFWPRSGRIRTAPDSLDDNLPDRGGAAAGEAAEPANDRLPADSPVGARAGTRRQWQPEEPLRRGFKDVVLRDVALRIKGAACCNS